MSLRLLKNVVLPVLAMVLCIGFTPAQADEPAGKPLSKADVEKIVHDYIVNNTQVILDSVDDYQKKTAQARQDEGLKKNHDTLFKDVGSPEVGNPAGDVTVVEFFDYNCHFCKGALPAVQSLLEKDKNIRFIFKDFPILGPTSETSAKWALAAQKQKKYFEFHKAMMNNKAPIDDDLLAKVAKDVGMDVEQAKTDAAASGTMAQIEKNRSLADELGIHGTPAFIVGDEVISGAVPLEEIEKKIAAQRSAGAAKK